MTQLNTTHQRDTWSNVYLGLGSNVGDSKKHLLDAINQLKQNDKIRNIKVSSLYISKPVDNSNQSLFYNAALSLKTRFSPHELLTHCKYLEKLHKRTHLYRWGPRSLDIDILCFEQLTINTPLLTLPHAEIPNRDFVIKPLLELNAKLSLPTLGLLSQLPSPPANINNIERFIS